MDISKRARLLRLIGLIALTVIVAVSVGLIIYFVDKKDKGDPPPTYVTVGIGERVEYNGCAFKADSVAFYSSLSTQSAGDGSVYCAVFLTVEGTLAKQAVTVDGQGAADGDFTQLRGYPHGGASISDGSAYIVFKVGREGEKYLTCGGYRIALGAPHNVSEG